jgi:CDGSH-type Zn-finger protein
VSRSDARIVVTKDGPYRVEGGLPLLRTAIVYTEYGEPVAWEEGPSFETPVEYELCRCGNSQNKPFCDASHEKVGFDGTETADRAPSVTRQRVYEGEGVVMTDDYSYCTHAGFCGDRFTKVWQMIEETADPEVRERLMGMVSRCPSGRLAYSVPPESTSVEPEFQPSIGVQPDGPYWVRGGVEVVSGDGQVWEVRNRVTLCRCGRSGNKPFCDGSHEYVGFSDPAIPS